MPPKKRLTKRSDAVPAKKVLRKPLKKATGHINHDNPAGSACPLCKTTSTFPGHGDEPYCTCPPSNPGMQFDRQMGVYIHTGLAPESPGCLKPGKRYYEAAVEAGVLLPEKT